MSIQEFYKKLVSTENNALVESLRRLSILDDPKAMFEGPEWIVWTDGGPAASQA